MIRAHDIDPGDDDPLIARLAAYDDALAAGLNREMAREDLTLEVNGAAELAPFLSLLDVLEKIMPRGASRSPRVDPAAADEAPRQVGRFRILQELGHGGFGVVYLAYDPKLGRRVALKLPRPETLITKGLRRRFMQEALAAAKLDHPSIVPVFETGELGKACYLVSIYCPGGSLAEHLAGRSAPLSARQAARLTAALAEAVHYAHDRGVLHRDIKPANVLLEFVPTAERSHQGSEVPNGPPPVRHTSARGAHQDFDFLPRLTDFGLARFLEADVDTETEAPGEDQTRFSPATRAGEMLGTPRYMAPEQIEGDASAVGRATDVYGLGVLLYETLTGSPPFTAVGRLEILRQVLADDPPPLWRLRPDVPRDLEAICRKCLEKQPERRYATAAELALDLARFLRGESTFARPLTPAQRTGRWMRRRPAVTALIALVILAVAGLIAGVSVHHARIDAQRAVLEASKKQAAEQTQAADRHRRFGEERDLFARQLDYRQEIAQAASMPQAGQITELTDVLDRLKPASGQQDLRGFEWHYLNSLAWRMTSLSGHEGWVEAVRFSRDGRFCASWDVNGVVKVWQVPGGALQMSLQCPTRPYAVVFSADSHRLIAIHSEGTIESWEVATGRKLSTRPGPKLELMSQTDRETAISSVVFSRDGREFAYTVPAWSREEFRSNSFQLGLQIDPSAALDEQGRFVLVWSSADQDGSGYGVFARRYDRDGALAGKEFRVNTTTEGHQFWPSAAINSRGEFAIVWSNQSQGESSWDVHAQRYNADGNPVGDEFQVNRHEVGDQWGPSLALGDDGTLVVAWHADLPSGSGHDVYARCFDAEGMPQGDEFAVNRHVEGEQTWPTVEMKSTGDFRITWRSQSEGESERSVYAQTFRVDGQRVGDAAVLSKERASGSQREAFASFDEAGKPVVTWRAKSARGRKESPDQLALRSDASMALSNAPWGPEFQVNTFTTGDQTQSENPDRDVAVNRAGAAIVVWSSPNQDGSERGVFAQRYDAQGLPQGDEFLVNQFTAGHQEAPQAAIDDAGNVVVAWCSARPEGDRYGVFARGFNPGGEPLGKEFGVDADTDNKNTDGVQVAAAGENRFLFVWRLLREASPRIEDIFAQWRDGQGNPLGDRIHIVAQEEGLRRRPFVATCPTGDAVIVWATRDREVVAQRVSARGELAGSKVCVNLIAAGPPSQPSAAMDAQGNFVVTWQCSSRRDGSGWAVVARRYNAQGEPLADEFVVNTFRKDSQQFPSVAMNSRGDFLIAWQSAAQDGNGLGVFAQRFDAHGNAVGEEFQVNQHTAGDQKWPNVALDDQSRFLITWISKGQDGDGDGIFARRGDFTLDVDLGGGPSLASAAARGVKATNRAGTSVVVWSDIRSDGLDSNIWAQCYDAQGTPLGEGKSAHQLFLANLETGETRSLAEPRERFITGLAFSHDQSSLAVGLAYSLRRDGEVQILDVASGKVRHRQLVGRHMVWTPRFLPDGKRLAMGTPFGRMLLWDGESGQVTKMNHGDEHSGICVALSHDGELLASGDSNRLAREAVERVRLWNHSSREQLAELPSFDSAIADLAFSPDDHHLAIAGSKGLLSLCRLPRQRQAFQTLAGHAKEAWCVAFSPDGSLLATGSDDHLVKLWDVRTGRELATLAGHASLVSAAAFTPDGRTLATASFDATIKLWDVANNKLLQTLAGHKAPLRSLAWHTDGTLLASGGDDCTVRLWDPDSGQMLGVLQEHTRKVSAVAFHPRQRLLFTGSNDGAIHLWRVSDPRLAHLRQSWRDVNIVRSLAIARDGTLLAAGDDEGVVRLYSLPGGELRHAFCVGEKSTRTLAFSPDGLTLACGGEDGVVTLWHVAARRELFALPGIRAQVNSIAFSPDGQSLAAASHDGAVTLWRGEHQP
jgi:WD40 repeat protein/serine/threonine protein kinase